MSKLREAAQAVIDTVDIHGVYRPEIFEAFERLRDALDEDKDTEFELWGRVTGHRDSRWPVEQFDGQIWPDGTALYVKIGEPGVKFREQEPKIGEQPPQHWDQLVANLMRYGMTKSTAKEVATGLMAMGWRRCAEGQKRTQHCALLEAAVLAEREACAEIDAREVSDDA